MRYRKAVWHKGQAPRHEIRVKGGYKYRGLLFATRAVNLALTATRTAYVGQIEVFKGVGTFWAVDVR